ncbi:MAG: hypothetical protein DLM59_02450 [Pseudonocardiales bacterium]|nr:MAG: hypothetical protein DLM59_02450 [Pseudonocardiales bacterium]
MVLAVVLAVLVVATAALLLGYVLPQHRRPPAFVAHSPGEFRLTHPDPGLPIHPLRVPGSEVRLSLVDVQSAHGKRVAVIKVQPPANGEATLRLGAGQAASAESVTVRVLHVYDMANAAYDAVDVVATPTG